MMRPVLLFVALAALLAALICPEVASAETAPLAPDACIGEAAVLAALQRDAGADAYLATTWRGEDAERMVALTHGPVALLGYVNAYRQPRHAAVHLALFDDAGCYRDSLDLPEPAYRMLLRQLYVEGMRLRPIAASDAEACEGDSIESLEAWFAERRPDMERVQELAGADAQRFLEWYNAVPPATKHVGDRILFWHGPGMDFVVTGVVKGTCIDGLLRLPWDIYRKMWAPAASLKRFTAA